MIPFNKHPLWAHVKKICDTLDENGYVAWLAGGSIRDGILGVVPHDFDVATNATVSEIEKLFEKTIGVGKAFGVMRVIIPGADIEVATFRKDGPYVDGRRPLSVEAATPEEDALRRDFTINALFYDPITKVVKDFVEGKKDLKSRLIRTVGKPEDRFTEDKLRIMRAVRFVSQLDFNLEEKTQRAVIKMASEVTQVSIERIRDELEKLFKGKRPDRGLKLLFDSGLLKSILPEVEYQAPWPVMLKKVIGSARQEIMGWTLLFMGTPESRRAELFERLKIPNDKKQMITGALENIKKLSDFKQLSLAEKKELAANPNTPLAVDYLETVNPLTPLVKKFLQAHPTLDAPWIKSNHLVELGIKPGKEMGILIKKAYEAQLSENVKSPKEAIDWIKGLIKKVNAPKA